MKRTEGRLQAGKRVRPLYVDCQTVRDAADFFRLFEAETKLTLPAHTTEGFAAAMRSLREKGLPLVLLMDEVDALFATEKESGEALAATWRALAQTDVCHFIFCGNAELAQRLDDHPCRPTQWLSLRRTRSSLARPSGARRRRSLGRRP